MNLFQKLIATAITITKQTFCVHGPWINDHYAVLNEPSCHCQKCWKTLPQSDLFVNSRDETQEEWIERSVGAGLSLDDAKKYWEQH